MLGKGETVTDSNRSNASMSPTPQRPQRLNAPTPSPPPTHIQQQQQHHHHHPSPQVIDEMEPFRVYDCWLDLDVSMAQASKLSGETVGDSSHFVAKDETLVGARHFHGLIRSVSVLGTEFADVKFDYDLPAEGEGHDHDGDDHDGDDHDHDGDDHDHDGDDHDHEGEGDGDEG